MRFTVVSSVIALAASAAALTVTYPPKGANIDLSKDVTIKWTSVSTDASSFSIHLVNLNTYPNVDETVVDSVETSDGSYTIKGISGIENGKGYQINLISTDPQNTGILAQSQQFNVTGDSSSSTSTSASSTSTGKSSTSTTETPSTSTSTTSPSSSSTTTGSHSGSSTLGISTHTGTSSSASSTSSGISASANASSTNPGASTSTGAAAALVVPAAAGSFMMGIFALFM